MGSVLSRVGEIITVFLCKTFRLLLGGSSSHSCDFHTGYELHCLHLQAGNVPGSSGCVMAQDLHNRLQALLMVKIS